ncbi:RdgB/HAM1 family non-canonical purine NTP pyrophosphatase [Candidatus Aerophobetes bacterium]|nr:RdgB/HAM1 family non-canonical purine NTP pyrophosphatase [Candidatus Aerophobetes bacterium]
MEVVIATQNLDKIKEIKELLEDLKIKIFTFHDFSGFPKIEEGDNLRDNALLKARTIAKFTGKISLADDTGLEVKVLGGIPGAFSSRFAGRNASYEDNNRKLLSLLKGIPWEKRDAIFRCVIAITDPQNREAVVEGVCEGKIVEDLRGSQGFGYDPLFQPKGFKKTFAEISLKEKNRISHRGKALRKAREVLKKWAEDDQ